MDLIMSCENAEPSHAEPDLAFDTTIGFETTTKVACVGLLCGFVGWDIGCIVPCVPSIL